MKKRNPIFLILGLVFFILAITTKNYFYIVPAILFMIAGLLQNKKGNTNS
ncbi:hypothetical protein [Faecalibacter bovis]|uniref:Uncharacterized protein n=1 Tax=Faecalibacter bovis TaxID=2898187 RepID=A0ABX7XB77_9FLAO|nr:hypothetical protein [Faecalibacter bovis]QTV05144.1 hypothetical protein J9309_10150 [Faecalibacter bovis]